MRALATILAGVIAITSSAAFVEEATAMPIAPPRIDSRPEALQVQYRHHDRRPGWHGGHRGFRDHRRGYRSHSDGNWYPLAAFGAGALIGGSIASQPRHVEAGINPRHYDWCSSRYRTYRASDNTYVPSAGMRAVCQSPYY